MKPPSILTPSLEIRAVAPSLLPPPSLRGEGEQVLKGLGAKVSVDYNGYRNDEWHEWTITPVTANKPCHMESGVFQGNQLSLRAASTK